MVSYKGAIEDVSSKQLDYITNVLTKYGFGDAKVTVTAVGKAGDNYASSVKRFVAENVNTSFKMIVKVAPTNGHVREASNTVKLFQNEYIMCSEVLPKFTELEIEAGIPKDKRLRYAEFYGAYLEAPQELILLEDLQESGFLMLDRFKSFNNETVKLVLKNLASLHALSYVLKTKQPKIFDCFKSKLCNLLNADSQNKNNKEFDRKYENDASTLLDSDKYKNAIMGKVSGYSELLQNVYRLDYDSQYSIIQHGDAWTNNLMFIMEGEKPLQCCMIDYQVSRVNSPVADLHYMIFNCTDHETRSHHFKDWINFYHQQVADKLKEFGLEVNDHYPRGQLDGDLKRHAHLSLGRAVLLSYVITRKVDSKLNKNKTNLDDVLEEIKLTELDPETKILFKNRVQGLIDTMFELGYLQSS